MFVRREVGVSWGGGWGGEGYYILKCCIRYFLSMSPGGIFHWDILVDHVIELCM